MVPSQLSNRCQAKFLIYITRSFTSQKSLDSVNRKRVYSLNLSRKLPCHTKKKPYKAKLKCFNERSISRKPEQENEQKKRPTSPSSMLINGPSLYGICFPFAQSRARTSSIVARVIKTARRRISALASARSLRA